MTILEFMVASLCGLVVLLVMIAGFCGVLESLTNDIDPWKNNK